MLFLHGTGNDHFYPQIHIMERCLQRGFSCHAVDLDGHGRMSTTILPTKDPSSLIESTCEALNLNPATMHLVGHSLGGSLILDYASRKAGGLRSAVLLTTPIEVKIHPHTFVNEARSLPRFLTRKTVLNYGLKYALPAVGPIKANLYPIRVRHAGRIFNRKDYVRVICRTIAGLNLRDKLDRVSCPMLMFYGELDLIAPVEQGREIERCVAGSRLVSYPGESHLTLPFRPGLAEEIADWVGRSRN